ncbi:hypothetical protein [Rhizohabitans arisaemae]|uniref:hypothetical protein n=1 Tax=Rhizohabitans arisaemae TaxID=2720610 RepID=UPI0024B1205A|nr:hypothetical protein [Rhizohabitans arisaemae]
MPGGEGDRDRPFEPPGFAVRHTEPVGAAEYDCPDDTVEAVRRRIETEPRGESFGNGRFVRNLFESARRRLAVRLVDQDVQDFELTIIRPEDITP